MIARPGFLLLVLPLVSHGIDLDGNAFSDVWERMHPTLPVGVGLDSDGDGVSDVDEVVRGTNPFSPDGSFFSPFLIASEGPGFGVRWMQTPGKLYSIEFASDPSFASPTVVETFFTENEDEAVLEYPAAAPGFYRLVTTDLDRDGDGLTDWEELVLGFNPLRANSQRIRNTTDFDIVEESLGAPNVLSITSFDPITEENWPDPPNIIIRRTGGLDPLQVALTIGGSAVPGVDYEALPPLISFDVGQRALFLDLTAMADNLADGSETVTVTLVPDGAYSIVGPPSATVTISDTPGAGLPTRDEAARFLTQATFGPLPAEISEVEANGIDVWIDAQMAVPTTSLLAYLHTNFPGTTSGDSLNLEAWLNGAVRGPDQLRQRAGYALSQILVISDDPFFAETEGVLAFHDFLLANAFGNYRDLLEFVTYSPMMARYLSHLQNLPPDPLLNRFPDENFAREIMQLFSIGLWELNPDGTRRLDSSGQPIPTYDNEDITALARVFTGLTYYGTERHALWRFLYPNFPDGLNRDIEPLVVWENSVPENGETFFPHDQGAKTFLGQTNPAQDPEDPSPTYAEDDIQRAIDVLFHHPNTGPFISYRLIQRLVTSNPSPDYVQRVAAVFGDNGSGVRGDLGAVFRAILTDPEARDPARMSDPAFGKLKPLFLKLVAVARQFQADSPSGRLNLTWIVDDNYAMKPLSPPSVFSFFLPDHQPAGTLRDLGLAAPEFMITNAVTAINSPNHLQMAIFDRFQWRSSDETHLHITLDLSEETALLAEPDALLAHLNQKLFYGQMDPALHESIYQLLIRPDFTDEPLDDQVKAAVTMAIVSPQFGVLR